MSRTPLFALLERALREAQQSNHTRIAPSEIVERAAAARVSRRRFIGTTAGAAAALAVQGCTIPRSASSDDPVLIVGAGIAGLTAAYRLAQSGVPFRIIEAQGRAGGRMYSLRDRFPEGQVIELGGELIDTSHTAIRSLAAELGIEMDDLAVEDPALQTEVFFFGGARRSEAEVVEAFRPIAAAIERDLTTLGGDGDVTFESPNGGEALDRISIAQWLDRNAVSGWIRTLLDVGYTTEFGLEPAEQSALNLLTMIDTNPEPFRIFGESDERFHVRGGNDRITTALAARLGRDVETSTILEAIREEADGSLRCSVRSNGTAAEIRAPQVLVTIPFTMLREVRIQMELPPAKRRAIAELGYGTNAKLMVGFDRRLWRTAGGSNGSVLTDLPFQLCWETSRHQQGTSGILTNFTGGKHGLEIGSGTDAEQARLFVEQLERVFPGVAATRAGMDQVRFHWPTHRFTKGSYASYLPGQWTAFRGVEGAPVRNLYFAGEHCSLEAQGFMEGGCETGEAAAAAILESRGIRQPQAA
jgi:monoamine oxidase